MKEIINTIYEALLSLKSAIKSKATQLLKANTFIHNYETVNNSQVDSFQFLDISENDSPPPFKYLSKFTIFEEYSGQSMVKEKNSNVNILQIDPVLHAQQEKFLQFINFLEKLLNDETINYSTLDEDILEKIISEARSCLEIAEKNVGTDKAYQFFKLQLACSITTLQQLNKPQHKFSKIHSL